MSPLSTPLTFHDEAMILLDHALKRAIEQRDKWDAEISRLRVEIESEIRRENRKEKQA